MSSASQKKSFALLRIAFGAIWLIDAGFKWNPGFLNNFASYLTGTLSGQPVFVQTWINLWITIISINPHLFAIATAITETIIALSLLSGIGSKWTMYGGIVFSFIIWSAAEGFGGPYAAGSTDIGAGIIYMFVFVALILSRSWEELNFGYNFRTHKN